MTIGIIGCGPGTGVTHLAIALCSYCASRKRKRTAYLELHARNEIAQLIPENSLSVFQDASPRPHFHLHGIDYYPCVSGSEIPSLLNVGYDYLILDAGSLTEADCSEFLRCDRKLVLGDLAPWKEREYHNFFSYFHDSVDLRKGFYYFVHTGVSKNVSNFSRSHHISIRTVPFIKNPFRISKEFFPFLEELVAADRG